MIKVSSAKKQLYIQFAQKMLEEISIKIDDIKNDRFLNVCDWYMIRLD